MTSQTSRSKNHKAEQTQNDTRTTALERSVAEAIELGRGGLNDKSSPWILRKF